MNLHRTPELAKLGLTVKHTESGWIGELITEDPDPNAIGKYATFKSLKKVSGRALFESEKVRLGYDSSIINECIMLHPPTPIVPIVEIKRTSLPSTTKYMELLK